MLEGWPAQDESLEDKEPSVWFSWISSTGRTKTGRVALRGSIDWSRGVLERSNARKQTREFDGEEFDLWMAAFLPTFTLSQRRFKKFGILTFHCASMCFKLYTEAAFFYCRIIFENVHHFLLLFFRRNVGPAIFENES